MVVVPPSSRLQLTDCLRTQPRVDGYCCEQMPLDATDAIASVATTSRHDVREYLDSPRPCSRCCRCPSDRAQCGLVEQLGMAVTTRLGIEQDLQSGREALSFHGAVDLARRCIDTRSILFHPYATLSHLVSLPVLVVHLRRSAGRGLTPMSAPWSRPGHDSRVNCQFGHVFSYSI